MNTPTEGDGLTDDISTDAGDADRMYRPGCGCWRCDTVRRDEEVARTGDVLAGLQRLMILCPICGNKRCPHATAHWLACTGSNDPGQAGSDYGTGAPAALPRRIEAGPRTC